ncbi:MULTISPECIES: UbiA-like protein EboC [unclassified Arcicella]|uniref:UbiA-like protein EboC n=1 Tax=unclassified Arcicella TaxID=2644986 RepID=UPI002861A802|nr:MULTISPECIES: UbiA-like protein EboC [unclassified Arcicella]MDR6562114.1 4-hydroxybenzoate polyprenyltransferase [Arcicella sp. BE51]MDR6811986.1 4-hydroxybenzoate polyprenyltransferase [Arcicella sp. BE140]MDR6823016.1 4-hydroxybenzoate polyprenyltransferase [Arcicella sp. BE139]
MNIKAYFQLLRPANIVTSVADIFAGISIAGFIFSSDTQSIQTVLLLVIATKCLYGGGIVYNDVFDAELDAVERPERPIPSGRVSKQSAAIFGSILLIIGIIAAFLNSTQSGLIAIAVAILALVYNRFGKHHDIIGPINMGLCRGGNLILGMSAVATAPAELWYLGIIPVIYIAAITMVSRGEVHGGSQKTLYFAGFLYAFVSISQLLFAFQLGYFELAIGFVLLHIYLIFKPLITAITDPIGPNIGKAVKAGVLSLIVMDAAWVSVSGNWILALCVLALLPLSMKLAKLFAVT